MQAKKRTNKKNDILSRMCRIQKEFDDAIVFKVGIREDGRTIDLIRVDNTFYKQSKKEEKHELEVHMPDIPEYIG